MAKRRREKKIYKYDCSLTGETFKVTAVCDNPEDLLSVKSWYEINTDHDDRPEAVKKKLGLLAQAAEAKAEAEPCA